MPASRHASLAAFAVAVAVVAFMSLWFTTPARAATIDRTTPETLIASLQEAISSASLDHYATLFHPSERADARWSQPDSALKIEVTRTDVRDDWAVVDLKASRDDWRPDLFAIKLEADPTRLIDAGWYLSLGQANRPPRWARDVIADYRSDRLREDDSIPTLKLRGGERVQLKQDEQARFRLIVDEPRYVSIKIELPADARDFTITLTDAAGGSTGVFSIEDRMVHYEDVLRPNAYLMQFMTSLSRPQTLNVKTSSGDPEDLPDHWVEWDVRKPSGTIAVKANYAGAVLQPRRPVRVEIHEGGDYVFFVRPTRGSGSAVKAPMVAVEHPASAVYDEGSGSYMTRVRDLPPGRHTILVSNWDMVETKFELEAIRIADSVGMGESLALGDRSEARRLVPGTMMVTTLEVKERSEVAFYARALGEGADYMAIVAKVGDPRYNDAALLGRGFDMLTPGTYAMFMYGFERRDDFVFTAYPMKPLIGGDTVTAPVSVNVEHYQVVAPERDVRVTISGTVRAKPGAREADSHFAFLALTLELAQVGSVVAALGDNASLTFQVPRGARVYIQVLCNKVSDAELAYDVAFSTPQQESIPSGAMRSTLNGSPARFSLDRANTQAEVWFELDEMAYVEVLVQRDNEGTPIPVRIEKYGVPVAADQIYIFVVRYMVQLEPGTYRMAVGSGAAPTQPHQMIASVRSVNVLTAPHDGAMTVLGGAAERHVVYVEEGGRYTFAYADAEQNVELYISTYPFDQAIAATHDKKEVTVFLNRGFYYLTARNHDGEAARGKLQIQRAD